MKSILEFSWILFCYSCSKRESEFFDIKFHKMIHLNLFPGQKRKFNNSGDSNSFQNKKFANGQVCI